LTEAVAWDCWTWHYVHGLELGYNANAQNQVNDITEL